MAGLAEGVIMATSSATTVAEYLAELPEERRKVMAKVRAVIRKHMPKGYKEAMGYGHITWSVPLSVFPDTYNGQPLCYVALAAQKNNYAVYLTSVYGDKAMESWWRKAYAAAGKRLDMGKSCVRFRRVEDLPLDVLGECIARVPMQDFVARYVAVKGSARKVRAKSRG